MQCFGKSNLRPVFVLLVSFCNREADSKKTPLSLSDFFFSVSKHCPTPTSNKRLFSQIQGKGGRKTLLSRVSVAILPLLHNRLDLIGRISHTASVNVRAHACLYIFCEKSKREKKGRQKDRNPTNISISHLLAANCAAVPCGRRARVLAP